MQHQLDVPARRLSQKPHTVSFYPLWLSQPSHAFTADSSVSHHHHRRSVTPAPAPHPPPPPPLPLPGVRVYAYYPLRR